MRRTKRTFLILLGVSILAYIILFNLPFGGSNSDTRNEPQRKPSFEFHSKLFNTSLINDELVFFSQCYCQKDLVYLRKSESNDNRFEISVRNEQNELVHRYYLEREWIENLKLTCNAYNSLRRGPGQKVCLSPFYKH